MTTLVAAPAGTTPKAVTVFRVTSGNFLEMFDFFLFAFYATYISKTFFPSENEFASLMATFMTFAAGFLMRPLGAIFLGAYIDRIGRRQGLIVTLSIMAVGTILIAFVPSYASIGVLAPILVVLGRLIQGFSAGVELGGVSVYLSEIATPGHKGFYVSWQSASQQVATVLAAVIGFVLGKMLLPEQMTSFGWGGHGHGFGHGFGHWRGPFFGIYGGDYYGGCVIRRFVDEDGDEVVRKVCY